MPISTIDQKGLNAPLSLTSPVLTTPNLGTPSALVLTNATGTPSAINLSNATALPKAALPTGSVLQVVQSIKTDAQVFNAGSTDQTTFYEIGDLTLSITPRSASSKILLIAQMSVGQYGDGYNISLSLVRNGTTRIGNGTGGAASYGTGVSWRAFSNNDISSVPLVFQDSPASASTLSYGVWVNNNGGSSYPAYINRNAANGGWFGNTASTLIAMEIAG